VLATCAVAWEIVVVDDGGNDYLAGTIDQFKRADVKRNVQLIKLSRNFGKEAALTAGLKASRGDAVICMDGDGQHPTQLIPRMLDQWRNGYAMVVGVQQARTNEKKWLVWAKKQFYRFLQSGERFLIPANAGDFRLMDRNVVNALLDLPERARYMKGLYAWLGFKTAFEPFDADARSAGVAKFRLRQLVDLAAVGVTSFSMKPLRMVSAIGVIVSILALGYGFYILIETLIFGNPVSGWATLASGIMLLSGIQFICLGVMAEYLGRIFEESKQRPLYIVEEKTDQSALVSKAPSEDAPDNSRFEIMQRSSV
jgi:glycosyltransferase involved in cell wall biosynthesis